MSIVTICWNDLQVIGDCLESIHAGTRSTLFEVIVSDNGSSDGSIEFIRKNYPRVRVIENRTNLRFSKANNVGIRESKGEYVLILNPDTIIHDGALDKFIEFAETHPEAGAFGCRVLNSDGSYQGSARPFPTIWREWIAALYLRPLAHFSDAFISDTYTGWKGDTERTIDWQSGCCVMFRGSLLKSLGGFDEQFFYYHEDIDLCRRVWQAGYPIVYTPEVTITHLGGQSTIKRSPVAFALDSQVTRYRYFYKYSGRKGLRHCRWSSLTSLFLRRFAYELVQLVRPSENREKRLTLLRTAFEWNVRVDPIRLVECGEEPELSSTAANARVLER